MSNMIIAEFTAHGKRIQLIAHEKGVNGYSIITRVLSNWSPIDVDFYNQKKNALARFMFLVNTMLLEWELPN